MTCIIRLGFQISRVQTCHYWRTSCQAKVCSFDLRNYSINLFKQGAYPYHYIAYFIKLNGRNGIFGRKSSSYQGRYRRSDRGKRKNPKGKLRSHSGPHHIRWVLSVYVFFIWVNISISIITIHASMHGIIFPAR